MIVPLVDDTTCSRDDSPTGELRALVDGWHAHPCTWTRPAEEVLAEANRKKTSNAEHVTSGFPAAGRGT